MESRIIIPEAALKRHPDKPTPVTIFTIGHSTLIMSDLIRHLTLNTIDTIIDVRSIPYSRIAPQFSKKNLEDVLTEIGFSYRFAGKYLGAYPDGVRPPPGSNPDWSVLASRAAFKIGISRVIDLGRDHRVVLLCAEENPYNCHRHHLIAPALIESGAHVMHLRHNGRKFLLTRMPKLRKPSGRYATPLLEGDATYTKELFE